MKRRIISFVIILALLLSASSIQLTVSADETLISEYQKEIEFLKEIKLLDNNYDIDRNITRGEATKLVISAIYPEADFEIEPDGKLFSDVMTTHQYYSYIKACSDMGIINGNTDSTFRPDEFITVTDFVVIMVNALSYKIYAEAQGGYPTGYLITGKYTGITNGVNLDAKELKADVAAKILYNSIFAVTVELESITQDGITISFNGNKNYLSERLGIYEYDAVVTDNGYVSLYDTSSGDGERIVIEEISSGNYVTAFTNGKNMVDYLGYRMKIFIRNNENTGRAEVVYFTPYGNDEIKKINADDIMNVTSGYIEYEKNPDSSQFSRINLSLAPRVIYNGKLYIGKNVKDYIPKDGIVEFFDINNDGKYDIIDILSFNYIAGKYDSPARNTVVDTVGLATDEEYIGCKFNPAASIDLNSKDYSYVFVGNEIKSLAELKAFDVVSVAECPEKIDGKTFYYLVAERNAVKGTVESTSDNTVYLENGKEFEISDSILDLKPSYLKRIEYAENTFYLDVTGKIAYVASAGKVAKNYAYMINFAEQTKADSEVLIKVFTKEEEIKVLPLSSKVTIDNKVCDTISEQKNALALRHSNLTKISGDTTKSRPIIFTENSKGYVISVNTDYPDYQEGTSKIAQAYVKQISIPYTEEEVDDNDTLKAAWRNANFVDVEGRTKSAGGKFFITSETLIMAVPEIDTYGLADAYALRPYVNGSSAFDMKYVKYHELDNIDENYKILSSSELTAKPYDIQAYDIDPDTGVAAFAVIRGTYAPIYELAHANKMSVFSKVTEAYDSEKEMMVTKLYYYLDGEELSATIDTDSAYYPYKALVEGSDGSDNPYGKTVEKLEPGDIIRISTANGKVAHLERVAELDKSHNLKPIALYTQLSGSRYTNAAPGRTDFPFDTTTYNSHMAQTYSVINSYAGSVKGTIVKLISSSSTSTIISAVNLSTPGSYNEMYFDYSGITPTVITINANGKDIRVEQGNLNDIITIEEAGGISGASLIITKAVTLNPQQMLIINGIENLPEYKN